MKQQEKIAARELKELEISNMPDKEFKVMFIEILNGLEKRVEDFNERTDKQIRNLKKKNQSEIKNAITEFKNTLDGIKSRPRGSRRTDQQPTGQCHKKQSSLTGERKMNINK